MKLYAVTRSLILYAVVKGQLIEEPSLQSSPLPNDEGWSAFLTEAFASVNLASLSNLTEVDDRTQNF